METHILFFVAAVAAGLSQLDGGWWRADNVPLVDPLRPAGGRRRHERFSPVARLPQRRLAYPRQVERGASSVAVVAARPQRAGWPGRSADADLDGRPQLHVPSTVVGAGRHGPLRAGAEALPP